ncbi:hypothetical protein ACLOJK_019836 [Asimina triloba]
MSFATGRGEDVLRRAAEGEIGGDGANYHEEDGEAVDPLVAELVAELAKEELVGKGAAEGDIVDNDKDVRREGAELGGAGDGAQLSTEGLRRILRLLRSLNLTVHYCREFTGHRIGCVRINAFSAGDVSASNAGKIKPRGRWRSISSSLSAEARSLLSSLPHESLIVRPDRKRLGFSRRPPRSKLSPTCRRLELPATSLVVQSELSGAPIHLLSSIYPSLFSDILSLPPRSLSQSLSPSLAASLSSSLSPSVKPSPPALSPKTNICHSRLPSHVPVHSSAPISICPCDAGRFHTDSAIFKVVSLNVPLSMSLSPSATSPSLTTSLSPTLSLSTPRTRPLSLSFSVSLSLSHPIPPSYFFMHIFDRKMRVVVSMCNGVWMFMHVVDEPLEKMFEGKSNHQYNPRNRMNANSPKSLKQAKLSEGNSCSPSLIPLDPSPPPLSLSVSPTRHIMAATKAASEYEL